jgi:SNF family Na+-dependent transporter
LLAWCFNFLIFSFQSPLPWAVTKDESQQGKFWNDNYFRDDFLHISEGVFDINTHIPWIMVSFICVTILTFSTIFKGMDSAKLAVYVIIPLPYFIMFILFLKGLTLRGNYIGWNYLFTADWSKLFTFQIWRDAAGQVIFSAGIGMNLITHFSSHKIKGEPIFQAAFWVPTLNFLTSFFAAITLFAFIGHASYKSGVVIKDMPIKGVELPFIAYPAIMSALPFPQFWSILFFIMLVSIGLGTEYGFVDGCCTIIYGFLNRAEWFTYSKIWVTISVSIIILIIDLIFFASDAGYYWLELFDHYTIGLNLLIFLYIQMLVIRHYLPLENLVLRVSKFGETFPPFYLTMIKYVNPVVIPILILFGILNEFLHPVEAPFLGK